MSILQSYRLAAVFPALLMGSVAVAQHHPANNKLVSVAQFKEQTSIFPYLDALIEQNDTFQVISFAFSMQVKGGEYVGPYSVTGSLIDRNAGFRNNADVQKVISRAKAGDKIYIEDIRAKGPDGRPRVFSSIVLTLN